ncbi:hypothetical protein [Arthrobacter sp. D2-10]
MKKKLWLAVAGTVVLIVVATTGTTGALWHDEAELNPGLVTTGSLELLAGGEPVTFPFDALTAKNLAPGDAVTAPLTITNSGSTKMTYKLESVSTGAANAATSSTSDSELASALTLSVSDDATCDGTAPESGVETLYEGALSTGSSAVRPLAPSSSVELCITVALQEEAPATASTGAISATFIFRGDQVQ